MNFFEKILEEKSKQENTIDYFTQWNYDKERKIWSDDENGWQITKKGSELNITHKDYPGVIRVLDYAYGDYELRLSERKNGPFPDPEPAEPVPPQPVPPQPEPPKPEQPKPEQPKPEQPQVNRWQHRAFMKRTS